MGEGDSEGSDDTGYEYHSLRLTDVELSFRLADRNERFALLDIFREDTIFHLAMICLLYTS